MLEYNSISKHAFESHPKRIRTYSADSSEYISTHPFNSIVSIDVEKLFVNDSTIDTNSTKSLSSEVDEHQIPKRNPLLELPAKSYSSEGASLSNEMKKPEDDNEKLVAKNENLNGKEEEGLYSRNNCETKDINKLGWSFPNGSSDISDVSKENKGRCYDTSNGNLKEDGSKTAPMKRKKSFSCTFGHAATKDMTLKINPVKLSHESCLNFKFVMEKSFTRRQNEKEQSVQRSKSARSQNMLKYYKSGSAPSNDQGPPPDIFVPQNCEEVLQYKSKISIHKTNNAKMDKLNCWSWHGDSIRETTYENKKIKQTRCYYIGIRRKNTFIYAHDIVLIHPPKQGLERPYVARIASLWCDQASCDNDITKQSQKSVLRNYQASMMMTVYWYYRPENIEPYTCSPSDMEVFESKHYDENSIDCIIDRAFVLSYHSFCRFCALKQFYQEASESYQDMTPRRVVPPLPKKDVSFPPEDTDISLVFFCRSAYNFNTGKISIHH